MAPHLTVLTEASLAELTSNGRSPCLSLYQPTHRRRPENRQDSIRFRNLMTELERSLRERGSAADSRPLLEPFADLAADSAFWNHSQDGLAVLVRPDLCRVFRLQRAVPELAIVAGSFHTKPLRRILQSADRYQVLGLSRGKVQLFEGTRDALDEVELAQEVRDAIQEALRDEPNEPHLTVASYGGAGSQSGAMRHGHGGKRAEADADAERFFRAVDRTVLEHHSRPSGLPLILAALPEHHPLFRRISHNPFLLAEGVAANPDALSVDELRGRAWQAAEPRYRASLSQLADEFAGAHADGLGDQDLALVAQSAVGGRVATLMIEADRRIAGRLDPTTGRVEFGDLSDPRVDDVLDDLCDLVADMGGQVVVAPPDLMPNDTGLAAIYRY